jgi:hypothetical protein
MGYYSVIEWIITKELWPVTTTYMHTCTDIFPRDIQIPNYSNQNPAKNVALYFMFSLFLIYYDVWNRKSVTHK